MEKSNQFFTKTLLLWHEKANTRTMPWKEVKDAYKVWLSEIILQQTRVDQGTAYYLRFLEKFPNIADLALASEDEVLKLWQGLGYYSRARNLHATAKIVHTEMGGKFPSTSQELQKLKGIGMYTAAAISSFVFDEVVAVVDGNVIRVLARYFGIKEAFDGSVGQRLFKEKANFLVSQEAPALYNQAIMDFGAVLCKPQNPLCATCPLSLSCVALNQQRIAELPYKRKKVKLVKRFFLAFHLYNDQGIIVEQRKESDVWKGLYQMPLLEVETLPIDPDRSANDFLNTLFHSKHFQVEETSEVYKQRLTHREMNMIFVKARLSESVIIEDKYRYTRNLAKFAFPKVFILYLQSKSLI